MPHIENTTNDSNSPPLYTFTSQHFLNVLERVRVLQSMFVEDAPELIESDVAHEYPLKEYLL